jgi:WD40 repeat protein
MQAVDVVGECGIKVLKTYQEPSDSFYALAWGRFDNKVTLAAAGLNGIIRLINISTNDHKSFLKGHSKFEVVRKIAWNLKFLFTAGAINDLKFHPGKLHILASASADNTARLWNACSETCIATFAGEFHENQVLAVEFAFDGKYLISCGMDKEIVVWNLEEVEECIKASNIKSNKFKGTGRRIIDSAFNLNSMHEDFGEFFS